MNLAAHERKNHSRSAPSGNDSSAMLCLLIHGIMNLEEHKWNHNFMQHSKCKMKSENMRGGFDMADIPLAAIQEKAMAYAIMTAEVLRLDVEIVDESLCRVAGTGIYTASAPMVSNGAVYRQILQTGKPAIIQNPRKNELCMACGHRDRCLEKLEICYPIAFEGRLVGAMGMVCSSSFEKNVLMENIRMYVSFIAKVCGMLSVALADACEADALQKENANMREMLERYAEEGYSGEICALEDIEKREIERALKRFGSDTRGKKAAAQALGIGVATLYRKLGDSDGQK